jgi:hypothetical protein
MQIILTNPVVPPAPPAPAPVAQIQLLEASYSFTAGTITLVWNELDSQGNLLDSQNQQLTQDQTTTFFATSLAGAPDLETAFSSAFFSTVTSMYGPGTVVQSPTPPST